MKKLLLFALAAGIGVSAYAQNKFEVKEMKSRTYKHAYIDMSTKTSTPVQHEVKDVQVPNPKGTRDIVQVPMGMSGPYGVYSVLTYAQAPLSYAPGIGTISFTHRGEENEHPGTDNSTIIASVSKDNGAAFNEHLLLAESAGERHRYPSGVLFNPAGNNDPNNAYVIAAGPSISATGGGWDQNFFASTKLDGTNNDLKKLPYQGTQNDNELVRIGMTSTNNGDVYIAGWVANLVEGAGYTDIDITSYKGTKTGEAWTWERHAQRLNLIQKSAGVDNFRWTGVNMAFAKDGSIGYKWGIGQTVEWTTGFQPVLFYTEDQGATWNEITIELADNEILSQYLPSTGNPASTEVVLPWFTETAGVVDANGHLQMMAEVQGHASPHKDSLTYYYPNQKSMLFNFTFSKDNGVEEIIFIDSIMGNDVNKDEAPQYCFGGEAGWNNRLQASISCDGLYVAASWGDTPSAADFEGFNASPDIKGTARHIDQNDFYRDPNGAIPNFTADDIYTGTYRFSFAAKYGKRMNDVGPSGIALVTPISTSISLAEFEGGDEAASITHSLLNVDGLGGVPIPIPPLSVEELETANAFTVSQNQPNPFTGTTTITVNSNTIAPVSVEVSNIMGQTVFTQNEGTINGSKQITIDASNLQAGIYFYTVRVGAESQTKKMMVK